MSSDATLGSIARELASRDICSLTPEALAERLRLIRADIQPRVIARSELSSGVAWAFESSPEMRTGLDGLAALERECCGADLEFRVRDDPENGRLHFEIHGAETGAFRALFGEAPHATSVSTPAGRVGALKRLAKAGGVGVAVSFFVCCVLPIGVAAVAGASFAGLLARLDQGWIIVSGAVVFGTATWLFERRREAARAATAAARGSAAAGCGC